MSRRVRVCGIHLIISTVVALMASLIVFVFWYPPPYAMLAGGFALFSILIGIDVVLGPVLSALVTNPIKPSTELRRDLTWIVVVQLMAFVYGMYTIALARPVHLVFEVDRFRVITAADIDQARLDQAPDAYRRLSWTGPTLIAARKSVNQEEMLRSLELGMQGVDISMQPDRWVNYASHKEVVLEKARPINLLIQKYPHTADQIQSIATSQGVFLEGIRFLPLLSRKESGVALILATDARVVGFLPVDGFFDNY